MQASAAFQFLLESSHVAAAVLDLEHGRIVEISPAYAALLGRTRE